MLQAMHGIDIHLDCKRNMCRLPMRRIVIIANFGCPDVFQPLAPTATLVRYNITEGMETTSTLVKCAPPTSLAMLHSSLTKPESNALHEFQLIATKISVKKTMVPNITERKMYEMMAYLYAAWENMVNGL